MKRAEDIRTQLLRIVCLAMLLGALTTAILVKLWTEHGVQYPFTREDIGYGGAYK